MPNSLFKYLADDHDRIGKLLTRAAIPNNNVDLKVYEEFRKALLRHISIEEKIAFPALSQHLGGSVKPIFSKLHLDHSALVELLVPTPNASVIATILSILSGHNAFEEKSGGIYELLGGLGEDATRKLLERFRSAPDVPTLPTKPLPQVIGAVRRSVERAGYQFVDVDV